MLSQSQDPADSLGFVFLPSVRMSQAARTVVSHLFSEALPSVQTSFDAQELAEVAAVHDTDGSCGSCR